ncbi:MAG: glycyl-tRNA synthetase beta chain [Rhodospirillaceae bacterium]|nr:glycyl-tRNA synthetase beta chain [Rhodospirillaceae bacterium]
MADLVFELLSEEIPARMQGRAAANLKRMVAEALTEAGLTFTRAEAYATPRRLALWVDGLPPRQPDREIEIKGPRVGAPDNVLQAFLKARGLASLEDCEKRDTGKGVFWFYVERAPGRSTAEVLAEILPSVISTFPWPKSMRWAYDRTTWVRPLQNIVAVFDGELVPFVVPLGTPEHPRRIASRKETYGHRFLGPQPFTVSNFNTYKARLGVRQVVLDPADRGHTIRKNAERLARSEGLLMRSDEELLEEVVGLVEWPVVLMGRIDPAYMELPPEVLTTAMRSHQKYFALQDAEGRLAPRFIVVANMETRDKGATIIAGNERVLRARLADAQFFWDQDRKIRLEDRLPGLKQIVFHAKLGSLADKVDRVEALALVIARNLPGAAEEDVRRAARLSKTDLTSGMVGEFPELQGLMGRYYALDQGESPVVAEAIAEHYAPLGPSEPCPTSPVSVAVALADKIDTLVGFWAIGEKPTGSKDPYALRRAALGAIRLIVENNVRCDLLAVFATALEAFAAQGLQFDSSAVRGDLLEFFADRLKVALKEKGVRHDLIAAIFALKSEEGVGEDNFVRLLARVDALAKFLGSEDGANLLTASKRAGNILRIEEKKDGREYQDPPDASLLRLPEEFNLVEGLRDARERAELALKRDAFSAAMAALARLRGPVDDFFDNVTVNAEDAAQRGNRLRLLSRIRATLNTVADFSKIEG